MKFIDNRFENRNMMLNGNMIANLQFRRVAKHAIAADNCAVAAFFKQPRVNDFSQ